MLTCILVLYTITFNACLFQYNYSRENVIKYKNSSQRILKNIDDSLYNHFLRQIFYVYICF